MTTKTDPNVRTYFTKSGAKQFMPSTQLLMVLNGQQMGFCLACSNPQDSVEPDGRKYVCDECGAPKVYGAEEIALMGLCFDADR